jgi:multicomponent Na+:H+ antiporter subunit D
MINFFPFIIILIPLFGSIVVWRASAKSEQLGSIVTAVICGLVFFLIFLMYPPINRGQVLGSRISSVLPWPVTFRVDKLGLLLGLVASFLWFLASIYAIEYMKPEHAKTRYHVFSLLSLCSMLGIVFTGDLVTLFIFFELLALVSLLLVIHEETPEAMKAGFKYLYMGIVGGLSLLLAIFVTYSTTGTVTLAKTGLSLLKGSPYFTLVFWTFILGFAVKAGVFPVHVWLPDAHPVAPSPASALLSGVMIKAGAYGIIRVIYAIFGPPVLANISTGKFLLILGVFTMILGSACAIRQTEIKRLLAYSSVAQMGYIIVGASSLSFWGITGAILHIFNHALMKGTLFLCAGAFIYKTGLRKIEDLKGIGYRMPLTMICFTLAACSMIGFPPFAGFLSKWVLAKGALQAAEEGILSSGAGVGIIGALLLSSLLNAVYYGPIVIRAWFGPGLAHGAHEAMPAHATAHDGGEEEIKHDKENAKKQTDDPSWIMLAPLLILAIGTLFFGVFPGLPLGLAKGVASFYFLH